MNQYSDKSIPELAAESVQALRENRHDQAIEISQEIIDRQPDHAAAHAIQFSSLFKSKDFEQARRIGAYAAILNPKSVFILNNQACLQLDAKQPAAAAGLLKSLIDQFGERAAWLYNLALAQRMVGNYEYAINKFRRTLDHQPDHDRAAFQLADCLQVIGQREEAVRAYDYMRLLRSRHASTHSNFIHHAVANNSFSETDLAQELGLWRERFIPSTKRYNVGQPSDALKMKIGFLIGVIPDNWLASMVVPVINELAQGDDQISVYWHNEKPARTLFSDRVNLILAAPLSDSDFARQVREDSIDVVIDICGMRHGCRQRALGLHLAGRQFGWLAHQGRYATPLVEILDSKLDPQRFYIASKRDRQLTVPENTFLGISTHNGLAEDVIKTWAYILHQTPGWSLHLDAQASHVITLLRQRFSAFGLNDDRIVFDAKVGAGEGSIVLDNFIENDPVTLSYALEQGAILVALSGPLFPAQQSAALLTQVGKEQWLCDSSSEYVARAVALAKNTANKAASRSLDAPLSLAQIVSSRMRNLQTFVTHFRNTISG